MSSNFDFLSKYWPDLSEIGKTAEMYLYSDSNACIYKLGLLSERIVLEICKFEKLDIPEESNNADRIRCLKSIGVIPKNIDDILFSIRKARNNAVHNGTSSVNFAKALLHMAYTLSNWFMEVYGDWDYKAKEYIEPVDHIDKNSLEERIKTQEEKLNELIQKDEIIEQLGRMLVQDGYSEDSVIEAATIAAKLYRMGYTVKEIKAYLIRVRKTGSW